MPTASCSLSGLTVLAFESRRATEMAELIRRFGGDADQRAVDARGAARDQPRGARAAAPPRSGRDRCRHPAHRRRHAHAGRRAGAALPARALRRAARRDDRRRARPQAGGGAARARTHADATRARAEYLARAAGDARLRALRARQARRRAGIRPSPTPSCSTACASAARRSCAYRSIAGTTPTIRARCATASRSSPPARSTSRCSPAPARSTTSSRPPRSSAPGRRCCGAAGERVVIASIGPVCSEAMQAHGLPVDLEPEHPKMGIWSMRWRSAAARWSGRARNARG